MQNKLGVFLDTSALFAGLWSNNGEARMIFKMGEAGLVNILIVSQVLREIEDLLRRIAPHNLADLAFLLDRCRVEAFRNKKTENLSRCQALVNHAGDAQILAEALTRSNNYS